MVMDGASRSTFNPVMGPAAAQLPARSQTVTELVAAEAVSMPAGTAVVRVNAAWLGSARPEVASTTLHATVTSAALHAALGAAQAIAGAVWSTWTMRRCGALEVPAVSVA